MLDFTYYALLTLAGVFAFIFVTAYITRDW